MADVDLRTQAWIKNNESLKLNPYVDTTGHLTVGWGRNLRDGIRVDEAELMFQNDLNRTISELERYIWYTSQPKHVKDALINMNFNLGITKLLEFTGMIQALEEKNYTLAAQEALNSLWAKEVGDRAQQIAVMLRQSE